MAQEPSKGGGGFAGFSKLLKEKAAAASSGIKSQDWSGNMAKFGTATRGAAEKVGTSAAAGGQWGAAYFKRTTEAAAEGIRKLTGSTLAGVCKHEAQAKPVPRLILVCCTAIVTNGLDQDLLFQKEAAPDLVNFLLGQFEQGSGAVLPPPGTSPHVLANAIKAFLITMPEPLLTFRLVPEFLEHGMTNPALAAVTVQNLPAPNKNTLQLLLETFYRLSGNAAHNEMDAHQIATVMAPCIAWLPPPKATKGSNSFTGSGQRLSGASAVDLQSESGSQGDASPTSLARTELAFHERQAIVRVLEYLIGVSARPSDGSSPIGFDSQL